MERVRGGVHGEHDIVLHRPVAPGESLTTWSQISAVRTSRAGTRIAVHLEQIDSDGGLAVEQWWTMVLLGLDGLPDRGTMPTQHRFPESARTNPLGSVIAHLDDEMHTATPRCPAIGRHTTSTSRRRARRASTSCSRTGCARWRSARTASSVCSASTIRASRTGCGSIRLSHAVGLRPDGQCLWHRRQSVAFEAAANGATTITHGRLELRT